MASYVLPLLSFPYLLRVLGPERFGLYGFIVAVARYGLVITDWGFPFTATRDIATRRARGRSVGSVYGATVGARLMLLVVCALGLVVITTQVDRFAQDASLYWAAFAGVAGSALFPVWLFQAFERLPLVTAANLAARVITTALIFLLVRSESDIAIVVWLWSAPWLATAVFALWAARARLGVRIAVPSWSAQLHALRDGSSVFLSLLAAGLYTASNALILGLLKDNEEVGYFVAAEIVVIAAVGLIGPLSQGLFPQAARVAAEGPESALRHARRALPIVGGMGVALGLFVFATAPFLGALVFGSDFETSVRLLQVMSLIPVAAAFAAVFSIQLMLPLKMDRVYSAVIVSGGLFNVALTLALVPALDAMGTAIAATTTESLVALTLFLYLMRRGLNVAGRRTRGATEGVPPVPRD